MLDVLSDLGWTIFDHGTVAWINFVGGGGSSHSQLPLQGLHISTQVLKNSCSLAKHTIGREQRVLLSEVEAAVIRCMPGCVQGHQRSLVIDLDLVLILNSLEPRFWVIVFGIQVFENARSRVYMTRIDIDQANG